jgi:hypothetical protein
MKRSSLLIFFILVIFLSAATFLIASYLNTSTDIRSQALVAGIPPVDQRSVPPTGAILSQNGKGLTNQAAMNNGNFQVEGYCSLKGLGAVTQNTTDWFCGSTKLTVTHFDEICRLTYNNNNTFVIHNGTTSTPAYNWRCYKLAATTVSPTPSVSPSATPSTTPTTTPQGNTTYNISDLNKNGKADPDDYRLFLEDYQKHL